MSATAMQSVRDKEWVALFPRHVAEDYLSSLIFIKQLTVVAVSTISYVKNAFSEDSYAHETFAGLQLKMLKVKCEDRMAQFVSTSVRQAFEAIDKEYVQQLAMCFYNGDCVADNLIEYHIFEYSYDSDGATFSINSKNQNSDKKSMRCPLKSVKTNAAKLIRSIMHFVHQNCGGMLPINYDLGLTLYYTEDCPEDYQAPGFREAVGPDHLEATRSAEVCHGSVATPYHKITARSFVRDVLVDGGAAAAPDRTGQPEITQAEHQDFQAEMPREPDSDSWLEPRVRCPCGKQDIQGQKLLLCQYCHTRQHVVCFGLLAPAPGAAHCCAACEARDPARTPTCSWLAGLSARWQECLCVLRRTLVLCSQTAAVSGAQLQAEFRLSSTDTAKILRLLAGYYILPDCDYADLEIPRKINHLQLKLSMKKFFRMDDEADDAADRLMMEKRQEATGPAGELLGHIETICLDKTYVAIPASTLGLNADLLHELFCDSPKKTMAREGVLEELPLAGSFDPLMKYAPTNKLKRKKGEKEEEDKEKPRKSARWSGRKWKKYF